MQQTFKYGTKSVFKSQNINSEWITNNYPKVHLTSTNGFSDESRPKYSTSVRMGIDKSIPKYSAPARMSFR